MRKLQLIHTSRPYFICTILTILGLSFWQCKSKSKFLELNPSFHNFALNKYEGFWSGELQVYTSTNQIKSVPMSLEIKKGLKNEYSWIIQYSGQESRNYVISLDSVNKNKYILDELNGIKLLGNIRGNILSFYFDVQNNFLDCKYIFNDSYIDYLIITGATNPNLTTQEIVNPPDTSGALVRSYYFPYFQNARLFKQKSRRM